MKEWITGRNQIYEVLKANRRQSFRLLVAQGVEEKGRLADILRIATTLHLQVERPPRPRLDSLGENPQGVALEVGPYPYVDLSDIFDRAAQRGEPLLILLLDLIQNPQNLGTLLRTAEAVDVHGVVLPLARTASITPAVVSASAGACEHLLVTQANLVQAIHRIKEANAWVTGLEASDEGLPPEKLRLDGSLALVVGSEGEGMRPLVRSVCDQLLALPMRGRVESLNAAVAGSIALYLVLQARRLNKA